MRIDKLERDFLNAFIRFTNIENSSEEELDALLNLLLLAQQSESKEEFQLCLEGIEALNVFTIKPIYVILKLNKLDPLKKQAIRFGLLREKN